MGFEFFKRKPKEEKNEAQKKQDRENKIALAAMAGAAAVEGAVVSNQMDADAELRALHAQRPAAVSTAETPATMRSSDSPDPIIINPVIDNPPAEPPPVSLNMDTERVVLDMQPPERTVINPTIRTPENNG